MAWRLARHHLDQRVSRRDMLAVAGRLCGVHAQVMSSAELTLWARVEDLQASDVADALWNERTLVKLWAMRGTLHLLPSADFAVWRAALGTFRHYLKSSWLRAFGVTAQELELLLEAVGEALGGGPLTREELATAVADLTGSKELGEKVLGSWGTFLKPACYRGLLCFAPSARQKVRFTRPDRWLGAKEPVPEDAALGHVARSFLGAHGPATRDDYARWWGVSPAQGLAHIRLLGHEMAPVDVEGTQAWMPADEVAQAEESDPARSVRLLPAFDQYVIAATRHARQLLPGPHEARIYRAQGWLSPVLLVDGQMAGVWRHERRSSRLDVRIEPFVELPAAVRRAAGQEAERLAAFLGGKLHLTWGER